LFVLFTLNQTELFGTPFCLMLLMAPCLHQCLSTTQ